MKRLPKIDLKRRLPITEHSRSTEHVTCKVDVGFIVALMEHPRAWADGEEHLSEEAAKEAFDAQKSVVEEAIMDALYDVAANADSRLRRKYRQRDDCDDQGRFPIGESCPDCGTELIGDDAYTRCPECGFALSGPLTRDQAERAAAH